MKIVGKPSKPMLAALAVAFLLLQALACWLDSGRLGVFLAGAYAALALLAVIHMYFTVGEKNDQLQMLISSAHVETVRQAEALLYIFSVVKPRWPLPPMRNMAISPDFAATLTALILRLRPQLILELGSGTSTVLCGYALELLGGGRVVSLDHEAEYADQTRRLLEEHQLERFAQVIHAPLREVMLPAGQGSWKWYDPQPLADLTNIDLVIVDGPPEWTQKLARYPALPMLAARLSPQARILIDDAARADERRMVENWVREFPYCIERIWDHEKGTVLLKRRQA